jgi:hypothetical protein
MVKSYMQNGCNFRDKPVRKLKNLSGDRLKKNEIVLKVDLVAVQGESRVHS